MKEGPATVVAAPGLLLVVCGSEDTLEVDQSQLVPLFGDNPLSNQV